jgi:hypothetical protein
MAIIGAPESWARNKVSDRTTLAEASRESKAVRRYGRNGARLDSTYGSTGGHEVHEGDIAPSIPARHVGHIGPARVEVVGHAPDGSGRMLPTTHDKGLIGNAIETHPPLRPEGMRHSASGGSHGKPSKVPAGKDESYRRRADAGALAGDSRGGRPSYTGGRGPIKP